MTATTQRQSAKIYQFPVGGVQGVDAWKRAQAPQAANQPIIIDNCWYHEEAMREPKPQ